MGSLCGRFRDDGRGRYRPLPRRESSPRPCIEDDPLFKTKEALLKTIKKHMKKKEIENFQLTYSPDINLNEQEEIEKWVLCQFRREGYTCGRGRRI